MMRRTVGLLLSFAMIFSLVACSRTDASERQGERPDSVSIQSEGVKDSTEDSVQDEQRDMTRDTKREKEGQEKEQQGAGAETEVSESISAEGREADLAYYTGGRADQEQNDSNARPAISGSVENMDSYDTILIGYPIWHGQAPRIISTFLESYDFSGKTIVPFCTSHSSGIGSSATNLHALCPDTVEWVEGRRFEAGTSRDTIEEWLGNIGII